MTPERLQPLLEQYDLAVQRLLARLTGDSGLSCRDGGSVRIPDGALPASGSSTFGVQASPGTEWTATLQYASTVTSAWGVNAKGQTYGVENDSGHPDLVPATADDGTRGWALWDEWAAAEQSGTVDVYASDGTTVVGHARVSIGELDEVPLDQRYVDDLDSVATAPPTAGPTD